MSLSDNKWECVQGAFMKPIYSEEDVRKAIQELKEEFPHKVGVIPRQEYTIGEILIKINKVFGERLTEKVRNG